MKDSAKKASRAQSPCGSSYFLGIIGSAVYFVQLVDGFWPIVLALLKALVWPAFLIYHLFKFLAV